MNMYGGSISITPLNLNLGALDGGAWSISHSDSINSHGRSPPYTLNLLKPTGFVKHHQFNIQQLYVLPTLYLCVLYLSENKQRLVPLTA